MYMCIYVYKDYTPKRTGRLSRSVRDEAEERRPETARLDDRRFCVYIYAYRYICTHIYIHIDLYIYI